MPSGTFCGRDTARRGDPWLWRGLAGEKDRAVQGAVARRLGGDLHRAELPGVGCTRHRDSCRSRVAHDECAASGQDGVELGAARTGIPALVELVCWERFEAAY